jgi:glycine betaine catabolism B
MHAVLDHREDVAHNITSFWFRIEKPWHHIPGQFTELRLSHNTPDERGDKRWFTISSSPTEPLVSFTTKFSPETSSYKRALWQLTPGSQVILAEPMGDFVLPLQQDRRIVFVAGGIGVTPYRRMIKWLLDTHQARTISLIYAVTTLDELAFINVFEQYGIHPSIVVSRPDNRWRGETGLLSAQRIVAMGTYRTGDLIYLSGPEPMVEKLTKDLQAQGISSADIISDYFPGYPLPSLTP